MDFLQLFLLAGGLLYILGGLFCLQRMGRWLIALGIGFNFAALIARCFVDGHFFAQLLIMGNYTVSIVIAIMLLRDPDRPVAVLLVLYSLIMILAPIEPALPSIKLDFIWAGAFFLCESISAGMVLVATARSFNGRDQSALIRLSFIIFTLSQITGGIWAYLGWTHAFSWSNRHIASAAVWCLLAALLHSRAAGITLRQQSVLTIVAGIFMFYLTSFSMLKSAAGALL